MSPVKFLRNCFAGRTLRRRQPRAAAKMRRRFAIEPLTDRTLLAVTASVSGGVLTIMGDAFKNYATISQASATAMRVQVSTTPPTGPATIALNTTFLKSAVTQVKFYASAGDDTFNVLYSVPTYASGAAGNDKFYGNESVDQFYGGDGDDSLYGYGNNDLLQGDNGDDKLRGDAGNDTLRGLAGCDGLFGSNGVDSMFGGADSDRFLALFGENDVKDGTAADATITFRNGAKTWTSTEIETIDVGLQLLHLRTRNDNLLENSTGGSLTYYREVADGGTFAANTGFIKIEFYDLAFESVATTILTTIHENGHNWDERHSTWQQWLALSGWRTTAPPAGQASLYKLSDDGNWYYLKTAQFTSSYSRDSAYEDLASSWETYFRLRYPSVITANPENAVPLSAAKQQHLEDFFNSQV